MAKAPGLEGLVAGELRREIAADGRSIDAVGQAAGFSRGYLSQLLRGRQDLKVQHVERVLAVLELDAGLFLRRVQQSLWESRSADAGGAPEWSIAEAVPDSVPTAGSARESRGRDAASPAAEEAMVRLGLRELVREIVRQELARGVRKGSRSGVETPGPRVDLGFEEGASSSELRREEETAGQDQETQALERVREILALPEGERSEAVRGNPGRYSGTELARDLLDETRDHLPAETLKAYALAGLAGQVVKNGEATPEAAELYALSLAHQGNALRAQGELLPAEELLESARFLVNAQGVGSNLARGELDSYEGSLRMAQRRLDEAEALFSRSIETYLSEGRQVQAGRDLIHLGMVHRQAGRLSQAVEAAKRADMVFAREGELRLHLMARHNLASYSVEAGDAGQARAILSESLPLYDQFPDPWTQLRRLWLEGKLSKAEGNVEAAEDAFRAVRDGFLEQGVGYDAALAALDLAFLYAERGRTAELKRVAEEIVPVFEAQDVNREAAAALMLFQEAVRQERASVRFLGELTRYLEQARRDPELRFRQSPE